MVSHLPRKMYKSYRENRRILASADPFKKPQTQHRPPQTQHRPESAVVEWLEQLGYGVESRRIARVRGSAAPCGGWKTLSVNPAENGYLFRIREG